MTKYSQLYTWRGVTGANRGRTHRPQSAVIRHAFQARYLGLLGMLSGSIPAPSEGAGVRTIVVPLSRQTYMVQT